MAPPEEKMSFLNSKWFTFLCCIFNLAMCGIAIKVGDFSLLVACSMFAVVTGYSFWLQMEEG